MKYINKTRFFALFLTLTLLFSVMLSYASSTGKAISNAVTRLHVIANSNSEDDQQLKLKVRDRILQETAEMFSDVSSPEDALRLAEKNASYIKQIAEDEIRRNGFNYQAEVVVGRFPFPTKVYGDISLPSGKYNALRVEIGEAAGENWWCVMYPPLCLTEGVVSVPSEAREQLKNSLSEDEYRLITQGSSSVPVEIKFKIVELFQGWF